MKKSAIFLAAAAIFVLFAGTAFANVVEFKFAHSGSLEHQHHVGAEIFKELVEKKSGGEMKVNIFPQAQLGGERDLAEGVRMGTIEMSSVAASNMAGFVLELQVFGIPFLFETKEQVYHAIDGEIGKEITDIMRAKGFENLAMCEIGFRNMTNNVRPIKVPSDMEGLKIRVQESKIWIEFMKRLGAVATPIPFGELYTALQQKVVDGQENPVATIYSMKYYEVQKYLSLTGHTYEPAMVLANPKWFNGLDPKHQAILKEAALETAVLQRAKLAEMDKERLEVIKKAGVEVEENPDKAAFAKATEDLHKVLADSVPEALVQKIKDYISDVK